MELPYDPLIPLLGIYPEETVIWKTRAPQFIAALLPTAKTWRQPVFTYGGEDREDATHTHTHTQTHTDTHMHTHMHTRTRTHAHTHTHTRAQIFLYVTICIYIKLKLNMSSYWYVELIHKAGLIPVAFLCFSVNSHPAVRIIPSTIQPSVYRVVQLQRICVEAS